MADKNEISLLHFVMFDLNQFNKKEIWSYKSKSSDWKLLQQAVSKCNEVISNFSLNSTTIKSQYNKRNKIIDSVNRLNLYFTITKDNIIFILVMKSLPNPNRNEDNVAFEFLEDLEHQGIVQFVDKERGEMNNVGNQNLMYLIEKHFSSRNNSLSNTNDSIEMKSFNNNNSSIDPEDNKIIQVTSDVNEIKVDMKRGIKKIIANVESVKELETRAEKINSTSLLFRKDADLLRRKTRWRNLKFMIIMSVIGIAVFAFIIYKLFA